MKALTLATGLAISATLLLASPATAINETNSGVGTDRYQDPSIKHGEVYWAPTTPQVPREPTQLGSRLVFDPGRDNDDLVSRDAPSLATVMAIRYFGSGFKWMGYALHY